MYRRITSYIYSYDNKQRQANCGYFRFDITENQCKLSINVKVPDKYTMGVAQIYLLKQENGRLKGVLIGKTCGLNGNICYKHLCTEDDIVDNIGIDAAKGIMIYNGESMERTFAGGMNDESIDLSLFDREQEEENTVYKIDEKCQEKWCEELEDEVSEEVMEANIMKMADKIESDEMEAIEGGIEEMEGNVTSMELKEENPWQEMLFSKFPKVRVNFGGENCEAIKMRPHDLVWFPRKYWRLSNNRCLLDGYYNYRYIMLVRGNGSREGNYYLAVPGKNIISETIAARNQGFAEFVTNSGDFGYWCCKVGQ